MPFYQAQKIKLVKTGEEKYYPMAVLASDRPVEIDEIAEEAAQRSTVHRADIKAVLAVLPEVLALFMKKGYSVHLQDLGSFRYTIDVKEGAGKATAAEVGDEDIKKTNIVFVPETRYSSAGAQTRLAPAGVVWEKRKLTAAEQAAADTPATDTEQTGGDTENPYDPFAG